MFKIKNVLEYCPGLIVIRNQVQQDRNVGTKVVAGRKVTVPGVSNLMKVIQVSTVPSLSFSNIPQNIIALVSFTKFKHSVFDAVLYFLLLQKSPYLLVIKVKKVVLEEFLLKMRSYAETLAHN